MSFGRSFSNIEKILRTSKEVKELLSQENVIEAVQREKQDVTEFLSKNITQVLDILLDTNHKITKKIKENAYKLLTSKFSLININVLKTIVSRLFEYLKSDIHSPIDIEGTDATFGVLHYLIKNTNCGVLAKFKQCDGLLPLLISVMNHAPVYNLLEYMTLSKAQHMDKFLESVDATGFFVSLVLKGPDSRGMFLKYIMNIITSYPDNENHYLCFSDPEKLRALYEIAFSGPVKVSSLIFDIFEMTLDFTVYMEEEYRSESELYNSMLQITKEMIPRMTDFITKDGPFLMDKVSCIKVVLLFSNSSVDVDEYIIKIALYLFGIIQKNKNHSIAHKQLLDVMRHFKKPEKIEEMHRLLTDMHMKEAILKAFEENITNKMFYFEFTNFVLQCEEKMKIPYEDEEEWSNYLCNDYASVNDIINRPYGGTIESDSDCDEIIENEDNGFQIDEAAIPNAAKLFGLRYIMDEEEECLNEPEETEKPGDLSEYSDDDYSEDFRF